MWETAAWGSCTGGMQNRTVSCQRIKGGSADAALLVLLVLLYCVAVYASGADYGDLPPSSNQS